MRRSTVEHRGISPACTVAALLALASTAMAGERMRWEPLPDLPATIGVAGPFVGVHRDALIVAGGANFAAADAPDLWETPKKWVDDAWVLLGSSNWDLRSLRLNFELSVECYDPGLARACLDRLSDTLTDVTWLTLADLRARGVAKRLFDRALRLLKPWL